MLDDDQRRLLGDFVRAHRERTRPDMPAGRRRTPGLRREELSARANISATWLAWIEQGRQVQASPQALGRLAGALQLSRAERIYLFELAGRRDPDAEIRNVDTVPASLRAAVAGVDCPAYGLDRFWNACCWNGAAQELFVGWLGEGRQKNLLRFIFAEPAARQLIVDWENRARRVLAEFRADYGHAVHDPEINRLLAQLSETSPEFAGMWKAQSVLGREGGRRSFTHPVRGQLHYEQHTFRPSDQPDSKFVMLVAAASAGG